MPARRTPVVLVEAAKVTAPAPPAVAVPADDPWRAPEQPWNQNPHSDGGVLKVPASSTACLVHFARQTIALLAALFRIRVYLVGRRGLDDQVRISYVKSHTDPLPVRSATIKESHDFRFLLEHMGHLCNYCYLPFVIAGEGTHPLFHYWTNSGRLCQEALLTVLTGLLRCAVVSACSRLRMTLPTSLLFLHEAHQLVIVGQPLTCHSDEQRIQEMLPFVQAFLDRNPVRAGLEEWMLTISSGLFEGGSTSCSYVNRVVVNVVLLRCAEAILSALSLSSITGFIVVVVGGAIHGTAGSSGPYGGNYTPFVDIGA
eukprot:3844800-Amphidinium_carterae.1